MGFILTTHSASHAPATAVLVCQCRPAAHAKKDTTVKRVLWHAHQIVTLIRAIKRQGSVTVAHKDSFSTKIKLVKAAHKTVKCVTIIVHAVQNNVTEVTGFVHSVAKMDSGIRRAN